MKEWESIGCCIIMAVLCACISQPYEVAWTKTIPHEKTSGVYEMLPVTHGALLVGFTAEDISLRDIWVVKVDMDGDTLWTHRYGYRLSDDCIQSVAPTHDGYILTGYSIDKSVLSPSGSILVIKISENGTEEWTRTYSFDDSHAEGRVIFSVEEGYIIMGNIQSVKESNPHPRTDATISLSEQAEPAFSTEDPGNRSATSTVQGIFMKIDSHGGMIWKRVYETNTSIVNALSIPGGYMLVGETWGDTYSDRKLWVQQIDQNGEIRWSHSYEKSFTISGGSIIYVEDGYILGVNVKDKLDNDFGLMKIDEEGTELWFHTYDRNFDHLRGVVQVKNGFILGGTTSVIDLSATNIWEFFGQNDVLIIRTDSQGKEIWRKVIGTEEKDEVITTLCVINGAVMLAGSTDEEDLHNIYLIKLA